MTIYYSADNQVGVPTALSLSRFQGPNVISGNLGEGIEVVGNENVSVDPIIPPPGPNLIQGNMIGTDITGASAIPNGSDGVAIDGSSLTTVSAMNVISGNPNANVEVLANSLDNLVGTIVISGNRIGTNLAGSAAILNRPSTGVGIEAGGVSHVTIDGGNVISGNPAGGINIKGAGESGAVVMNNFIGTDLTGESAIGNGTTTSGVFLNGVDGVTVAQNVISGNAAGGVQIGGAGASGEIVTGNRIGTDLSGEIPLGNGTTEPGLFLNGVGTSTVAQNVISGNSGGGMRIEGAGTSGDVVTGNFIGTNSAGESAIGNGTNGPGLFLNGAGGITVAQNVISGNLEGGLQIGGAGAFEGKRRDEATGSEPTSAASMAAPGTERPSPASSSMALSEPRSRRTSSRATSTATSRSPEPAPRIT